MGGKRREGRGEERREQEGRIGQGKRGERRKERRGEGRDKREGDAPLTQIPGSAPGPVFETQCRNKPTEINDSLFNC